MVYSSINIQGNIISSEILDKIRTDENFHYQKPEAFGLARGASLRDEIGMAWAILRTHWQTYRKRLEMLPANDTGTSLTREKWIIPLLTELGYEVGKQLRQEINGKSYAISHGATNRGMFPIHIMGFNDNLDQRRETGGPRLSPHALAQEYLNNSEYLFALVTNGKHLRLLRDATRLVRMSYLEFDLERMMEEELYADFSIMYRVLHASRMPANVDEGAESIIEFFHQESLASGSRIREKLSDAVEESIKTLANGFLSHPQNESLTQLFADKQLTAENYYLYQLRLIYRILFLIVLEERKLVYPPNRDEETERLRKIYFNYYSVERLRKLAENRVYVDADKHDLWQSLKATFLLFENETLGQKLAIKPLGSGLFAPGALGIIEQLEMTNGNLLAVLRKLTTFFNEQGQLVRVNYSDLDVEEFGSVYEGLLEYDPSVQQIGATWEFSFIKGDKRSRSGSHYTPEELVKPLIKHSLDYIIEERLANPEKHVILSAAKDLPKNELQQQALLSITVCDVACGSGHILLSAARRIATELASIREGAEQPSPAYYRAALRDVIKNCIYGVDLNPLAVELCKVALWLESHNPGEPLGFLDHHIKCGNSIVGLTHRNELENGIADEAFKTLPGDDKDIAATFLKKNKQERSIRADKHAGAQMKITDSIDNTVQESIAEYRSFARLPETTPDEIDRKAKAYRKFIDGKGYSFLKAMADTQVAQFFIPKTDENKHRLITDADYRLILEGQQGWTGQQTAYATAIGAQKHFFHWFLEFPEIFTSPLGGGQEGASGLPAVASAQAGFDCILGNPPFLGGKKISGMYSDSFLNFIKYNFHPADGGLDLVTYFFRRIFSIIKEKGFQSLISTKTIYQGDSRIGGLEFILKNGGCINFAIRLMTWPGRAAVEISLISIHKSHEEIPRYLNNKRVNEITSRLDSNIESSLNPEVLERNKLKSFIGTVVNGLGFIIKESEIPYFENEVIYPYLSGDDLNNDPKQFATRSIINFQDLEENICQAKYPIAFERVKITVKPQRNLVNRDSYKKLWWQYAEKCSDLYRRIDKLDRVLVIPRVSKYLNVAIVSSKQVFMDKVVVLALKHRVYFAKIQNSFFEYWAWKYSSTLGSSTINFRPTEAFQTFPFPRNLSPELEQKLETIGEAYHEHRRQLMLNMQLGLTKTYNAFHAREITPSNLTGFGNLSGLFDKKTIEKHYGKEVWNLWNHLQNTEGTCTFEEAVAGIIRLRELHVEMDNAVLEAYGWSCHPLVPCHPERSEGSLGIALKHDFYEVDYLPENDRIRYTIHPEARKEILKRLLLLNHERYEEEILQGLHKKADVEKFYADKGLPVPAGIQYSDIKSKLKKIKKETIQTQSVQRGLFDDLIDTTMKEFNLYDGIYSIRDTADIINQPYDKVRRWFLKLSEANYEGLSDSAKTDIEHRRICFHGLVELVVIGELLEAGVKPKRIFKAREALSVIVEKSYPFATEDVKTKLKVAGNDIIFDHEKGLVTLDGSGQFNLAFIREFFADIEFKLGIAIRYLPAKGLKRIQINPEAAGGRPAFVSQKNVQVEAVLRFYKGPDSVKEIIEDYDISEQDIEAALAYQS